MDGLSLFLISEETLSSAFLRLLECYFYLNRENSEFLRGKQSNLPDSSVPNTWGFSAAVLISNCAPLGRFWKLRSDVAACSVVLFFFVVHKTTALLSLCLHGGTCSLLQALKLQTPNSCSMVGYNAFGGGRRRMGREMIISLWLGAVALNQHTIVRMLSAVQGVL